MATALLFMVVLSVSGTALLSVSLLHRQDIVRAGLDVRLLVAAEAAVETKRGQFVLIDGVQNDWTGLLPTSGWNNIGPQFSINGLAVQVQAMPVGSGGHPIARVRGIAYGYNKTRAVEYTIRASSFADYALYFGSNNGVNVEEHTKILGPYYSKGNINLNNGPGIEFYSHVETSGKVTGIVDPIYNFKQGYLDYVPNIALPPVGPSMSSMRAAAQASGTLFYANTISIQFTGTSFTRTYRYRTSAGYVTTSQPLMNIPDNSVIYVDDSICPFGVDSYSFSARNFENVGSINTWGVLNSRRVTMACEQTINVTNNIAYQTLLDNPDLRRLSQKESPEALNFREMLGMVSQTDLFFEKTVNWTPLPAASMVTDNAALSPPDTGHLGKQYCVDGVYMGFLKSERGSVGSSSNMELWVTGGIITGTQNSTFLKENFDRRNYFTDYRIQFDPPPFFPRAFGGVPKMIPGTWRSYEL